MHKFDSGNLIITFGCVLALTPLLVLHNCRLILCRLQDSVKQAKKFEESQKSRQGMSGTQSSVASVTVAGAPDIQFVNADFIRQQLGTVDAAHKSGASLTTVPVSTQVKLPRGSNLYHASLPGQVVVLKTEKEGTPSPVGDPPEKDQWIH